MSTLYDSWYKKFLGHAAHVSPGWRGVYSIVGLIAYAVQWFGLWIATPAAFWHAIDGLPANSYGIDEDIHGDSVDRLEKFGNYIMWIMFNIITWIAHLATRSLFYWALLAFVTIVPVYLLIRYFSEDAYTPNAAHY